VGMQAGYSPLARNWIVAACFSAIRQAKAYCFCGHSANMRGSVSGARIIDLSYGRLATTSMLCGH
jgi:hypothetical protein